MESLRIAHLFPDLLNLYGDGGNVKCLAKRIEWRGMPVETVSVNHGETIDLSAVDIVFLGGGPDREQRLASEQLLRMRDDLSAYVEADGVLLAICGGYQILGSEWLLGDESVEGLGIVDMVTKRADGSRDRLIDNVVLRSPIAERLVVGYENHAGRYLHGPLLGKNPEIADHLIARALEVRAARMGIEAEPLRPLDDAVEIAANDYMVKRLGVR